MPLLTRLTVSPIIDAPCDYCVSHGTARCPACAMRRRRAVRLAEQDGLSIEAIARHMRLTIARVSRLLEQEAERRSLDGLDVAQIPTARVRELVDRWQRRNPGSTLADLTRLAGYSSQTQVERYLGLKRTSDTRKNGVSYPGRVQTTVAVEHAARLVRAIGYAPCEVEGL